jgi:two-component system OmpR family response regulator
VNVVVRLLIVEDELDLLESLAQFMREQGYAVDTADNGEDAWVKATSWNYDALILDWMLPKLSGVELLRRLRITKKTPVILLTARDAVEDRVLGLDEGADDYLIKPFNLNELAARVRALVRRAAGQAVSTIEIGSVIVDLATQTVTDGGQLVPLTAREYALVELLALHRGRLVSRTMIYDHIFDEEDDSLSNLVEVHMSHIRKKLGKDFIETRRGQGYILNA